MIDISIIIVSYNSADVIELCLASIFKQDSLMSHIEVLVVDNASSDSTVNIIREKFPSVLIFQNNVNYGYSYAVNRGYSESVGKYILILNPDTVLEDEFIKKVINLMDSLPEIGILGVSLISTNGKIQPTCWKEPSLLTVIYDMMLPYFFSLKLVTLQPEKFASVPMVSGACMIVRKDVFQTLGGFDERFFLYYEDVDFCYRARKLGYKIFFTPDIKVIHHQGKSSFKDMKSFFINLYISKFLFFEKHHSWLYANIVRLIIIIGAFLRILIYPIVSLILWKKSFLKFAGNYIKVTFLILGSKYGKS